MTELILKAKKSNLPNKFKLRALQTHSLAICSLKEKDRFSISGIAWWGLEPIALICIYGFLVTNIFNTTSQNLVWFIAIAIIPWRWFHQTVISSVKSIKNQSDFIKQTPIRIWQPPISETLANAYMFAPMYLMLISFYSIYNGSMPSIFMLHVLCSFAVFNFAVSLIISLAGVLYKELHEFVRIGLRFLFYGSPIIYVHSMVPSKLEWLWEMNPLLYFFEAFRGALSGEKIVYLPEVVSIGIVSTIVLFCIALFMNKWQPSLMKYL